MDLFKGYLPLQAVQVIMVPYHMVLAERFFPQ